MLISIKEFILYKNSQLLSKNNIFVTLRGEILAGRKFGSFDKNPPYLKYSGNRQIRFCQI